MTEPPLLDPKLDLVFKMLFAKEESKPLLASLLTAVLDLAAPPTALEVLNPELPKNLLRDRNIVLDVHACFADGSKANVEMQAWPRPARRPRALYHWSRLQSSQLVRGDDYTQLRRCTVIFILNFNEFEEDRFHSIFRAREIHSNLEFSDHFELHFLELPKLGRFTPHGNNGRLLEAWGKFFTARTRAQLEELTMVDPVFSQAKKTLEDLSDDPEARRIAEDLEFNRKMYHLELYTARQEGFDEGRSAGAIEARVEARSEGRAEGRAELFILLLSRKFGELSDAVRMRVSTATPQELELWAERLLFENSLDAIFEPL